MIAATGGAEAVGAAIGRFLGQSGDGGCDGWDLLEIDGIVENDPGMVAFAGSLRQAGASIHPHFRMSTWHLPCDESWEGYLSRATIDLHQARWNKVGHPGAFASIRFREFITEPRGDHDSAAPPGSPDSGSNSSSANGSDARSSRSSTCRRLHFRRFDRHRFTLRLERRLRHLTIAEREDHEQADEHERTQEYDQVEGFVECQMHEKQSD